MCLCEFFERNSIQFGPFPPVCVVCVEATWRIVQEVPFLNFFQEIPSFSADYFCFLSLYRLPKEGAVEPFLSCVQVRCEVIC